MSESKKIYISGKITGIENSAMSIFQNAETKLSEFGYSVVNPMKLNHDHDKDWHSYMRVDIKALVDCDEIYMLNNWTDSKGAILEHTIAMMLGIKPTYQTN